MSDSSGAVVFLKRRMKSLFVTALFATPLLAQTRLDDVHIIARETAPLTASTSSSIPLTSHTYVQVIKKDVSLVLVPVSVTDAMERLVTGLNKSNFQVFEGKKPQEIKHFSNEDAPVSVGIIVDTSGSMKDKMDRVREAVNQFCDAANLQDEFFLITFSDEPRLAADFTPEPQEIEKELLFTRTSGQTALLDAIYLGLRKMRDARYAKKALLIISDGGDNHSRYSEHDVKSAVKESEVMIYSIGTFDRYAPTREEVQGPELLSDITQPTGGRSFVLQSSNQMPEVAHLIGTELRIQYVLGYRPQAAPRGGKWQKIKVTLRLSREFSFLRVHAKAGYYAPGK